MFGSIRKLAKDRKGAFAMQFALMAVPMCVCTGLAIDGGRAFLARYELASALDAAALAVGSTTTEGADLNAVAKKYVDMNFRTEHDKPIELHLDVNDDRATLRGTVEINTYFMPLVGHPTVTVSAESEVRVGGNNVEVAMALDVTGSMAGTRITGLQQAAKILIDEVVGTVQTPYFSKIAIVPWSQSVYVGTKHANASVPVDLRGTPTATTPISAAAWRKSGTSIQTIKSGNWRTNTGKTVSTPGVTWKSGSTYTITKVTKSGTPSRVQVTVSGTPSTLANGDFIYLLVPASSPVNSYTTPLHGVKFMLADKSAASPWTFNLKDTAGTYITPPAGSVNATTGTVQECFSATCELQVTATSHGFANGARINIQGVTEATGTGATTAGTTTLNNTTTTTYTIGSVATNTFILTGTNGPAYKNWSSGGTASECYTSDCKYRIETYAAHGFTASDSLFMWNLTQGGSGTTIATTTANSSFTPLTPSGVQFFLSGTGSSYKLLSAGSVAACANTSCNVDVTSTAHNITSGNRVEITGLGGMTFLNSSATRRTWATSLLTANSFRLVDSTPALDTTMSNDYTGGTGAVQCLTYGCAKLSISTSITSTPYMATPCMVERYGANAATDVSPATTPLGILYASGGTCTTTNYVTPMTADRSRLNTSIDDLKTGGSTAGQIGIAWAWYMLSPNFKDVWDKEAANQPKDYTTKELVKVAVLMTDGEFNYSTCKGVASGTLCTATDEFTQAEAICQAMKDQKITIYTVGLGIDTSLYADDFLIKCASKPSYAFLAADTAELKVAFKKVATSISKLRISK